MEHNANHIILLYCHLSVSCRIVDWCDSLGSYKPQVYFFLTATYLIPSPTLLTANLPTQCTYFIVLTWCILYWRNGSNALETHEWALVHLCNPELWSNRIYPYQISPASFLEMPVYIIYKLPGATLDHVHHHLKQHNNLSSSPDCLIA